MWWWYDDNDDDLWLRAKQEKAQKLFEANKNQSAPTLTTTFPIVSLALAHYHHFYHCSSKSVYLIKIKQPTSSKDFLLATLAHIAMNKTP